MKMGGDVIVFEEYLHMITTFYRNNIIIFHNLLLIIMNWYEF